MWVKSEMPNADNFSLQMFVWISTAKVDLIRLIFFYLLLYNIVCYIKWLALEKEMFSECLIGLRIRLQCTKFPQQVAALCQEWPNAQKCYIKLYCGKSQNQMWDECSSITSVTHRSKYHRILYNEATWQQVHLRWVSLLIVLYFSVIFVVLVCFFYMI